MKKFNIGSILVKLSGMVAGLALLVTASNVNSTCVGFIHQPKLPKDAKSLRKF